MHIAQPPHECFSFVTFIGISYQIPGSVASERALLLTEHMKAMGLLESARILCLIFPHQD